MLDRFSLTLNKFLAVKFSALNYVNTVAITTFSDDFLSSESFLLLHSRDNNFHLLERKILEHKALPQELFK